MLKQGHSQKYIAHTINKDKSTESRELCRNRDLRSGKYHEALDQRKYKLRQEEQTRAAKETDEKKHNVHDTIKADWITVRWTR